MLLARFSSTRPPHVLPQERTLAWLARAHAQAEATRAGLGPDEHARFAERLGRAIDRCACPPDKIRTRGVAIDDVTRDAWAGCELYDVATSPHGAGTAARNRRFVAIVDDYFAAAYAAEHEPPDDLVHVTCTGYASPSGAQKLVARKGWGARTRVTHAYHMGCYAAVPAVRLAAGMLAAGSRTVDLVHTELCSLHLDPAEHSLEQLVVQSLFADGMIRYQLLAADAGPGLAPLALHEQVLPDTDHAMSWVIADHGMKMTLAREVPERIAGALRDFVVELFRRAGLPVAAARDAVFAVHPGGPRIIDGVRDTLELAEPQVAASRGVLRDFGNMSSATLPHIWMRLVADPAVPPGTLVPSLAFGPGLTMCGALFEKR